METNQMILEKVSPYEFDRTVELLLEAAQQKEWQVPFVHDLQQSLAKSGKSVNPVKVIEICKPKYSGQMLERSDERIVSVMMPCRISVYQKDDGKIYIALLNVASLALGMPENIRKVMIDSSDEVTEIVETLLGKGELVNS